MSSPRKGREERKAKAVERLRALLPPGSTIYMIVRSVSRSGMTRWIDCYAQELCASVEVGEAVVRAHGLTWIGSSVALAVNMPYGDAQRGVKIGGCGMNMCHALARSLGWVIHPTWTCTGEGCDHPDHRHYGGDSTWVAKSYGPETSHRDYSLKVETL